MKTAMEELIEMMNDAKEKGFQNLDWLMLIRTYSLLEKEKKQIINAYLKGDSNGCGCYEYATNKDAEEYYNQTYQNK